MSYPDRELTEQQRRVVALTSNRHAGTWNNDILANKFDMEDMKLSGFKPFEMGFDSGSNIVADEWSDMPIVNDSEIDDSYKKLIVHFDCEEDIRDFEALIKQKITDKTKYIHFPFKEKDAVKDFIVTSE